MFTPILFLLSIHQTQKDSEKENLQFIIITSNPKLLQIKGHFWEVVIWPKSRKSSSLFSIFWDVLKNLTCCCYKSKELSGNSFCTNLHSFVFHSRLVYLRSPITSPIKGVIDKTEWKKPSRIYPVVMNYFIFFHHLVTDVKSICLGFSQVHRQHYLPSPSIPFLPTIPICVPQCKSIVANHNCLSKLRFCKASVIFPLALEGSLHYPAPILFTSTRPFPLHTAQAGVLELLP